MSKTEEELHNEYKELQKKTKQIMHDRKVYNEETQARLKKHKNLIESLQEENEKLRNDLIAQANQLTRVKSSAAQQNLLNATEEIRKIKELIENEENTQMRMTEDINTLRKDILDKKKKQKGTNGTHERHAQFQKQIRILENRLDKANQKFNEAIAKNKKLRENIDSLRRERVIFDNIYRKLEKELHSKREKMANIIETANTAYEQRDIAQEELATLIQQAEREKIEFENGLKQVNESMKKYNEMSDFMKNKNNEKAELEKMNIDHKNIHEDTQQLDTLNQNKDKQNTASASLLEKVESYEETFAKIEAATGIQDIDELINTFKFVNVLSTDIDSTEKQINEMKAELAEYMNQGEAADNEKRKILNELEDKLLKIQKKAEQYELEYQNHLQKLENIKAGIESIFATLKCTAEEYDDLLGTQGVTESNMMVYLGIIEQNINEVVQAYAFINLQKAKDVNNGDLDKEDPYVSSLQNMLAVGPIHEPMHGRPRVEPPLYYDDLSDDGISDGINEKPLKFEEFQQRVQQMDLKYKVNKFK